MRPTVRCASCILVLMLGLGLDPASIAHAASPAPTAPAVVLSPLEDDTYGVRAVVPAGWTSQGQGIYTRATSLTDAADHTFLTIQSAPLKPSALWPSLEPQLALTDPPSPTGTRATDALGWSLYHVDVTGPSETIAVDLAMAESDGKTWIVTLWTTPQESTALHDDIFLPVLDSVVPLTAPPPAADLPYTEIDVAFGGGTPGVTLSGTLSMPKDGAPHPAVVLLTGSGPQDRDESIAPAATIKPFALIADALARAGVAVLRYDDRGVGSSSGDYASASIDDLTRDAMAAVAYLRSQPEIDSHRVGALGHSEGGMMVASMADADPTLAFVVAMAAPAVPGIDLLVAQVEAIARASGQSEPQASALGQRQRQILLAARDGNVDELTSLLAGSLGDDWDRMTPELRTQAGPRDAYIERLLPVQMAQLQTPEMLSIVRSDTGAAWRQARVPVLAFFGGKDTQVPAVQNAPAMAAELATGAVAPSTIVVLPDANHLFQSADTGSPAEYGTLEQTFTSAFLPSLVDWVVARVGSPPER